MRKARFQVRLLGPSVSTPNKNVCRSFARPIRSWWDVISAITSLPRRANDDRIAGNRHGRTKDVVAVGIAGLEVGLLGPQSADTNEDIGGSRGTCVIVSLIAINPNC